MSWTLRTFFGAASAVATSVAANQILTDKGFAWNWAYPAMAAAFLTLLLGEAAAVATGSSVHPAGTVRGRYLRQLRASVRDMETSGLATPGDYVLRMRQVYVDVALRHGQRPATPPEERTGLRLAAPGRRPLSDFLAAAGAVYAVLGAPGSGKTTLVRHTARVMSGRSRLLPFFRIPVLLYLRGHAAAILAEDAPGLPDIAAGAPWLRGAVPASWLERRLARGRCVVLLDGLDEVADAGDRSRVVAWVDDQIRRYPGNTFVVTSRPHGYVGDPLPNAEVLQVQRFTGDQVSRFLHSWYRATERRARGSGGRAVREAADGKADNLIAQLQRKIALYDLTANPLLLTMIAHVHQYRGSLPGTRAALYAEMCDVLLHRRQESKHLDDPIGLSGAQKETVAAHLAFHMMREGRRDIPTGIAAEVVTGPLAQVSDRRGISARFLTELTRNGLLVQHEEGSYAFAHLTLQEYLAAAHLREHGHLLPMLTDGVDDPWLRETALLWASRSDATPVVEACLESGSVRALTLAFDCLDEARQVDPVVRARLLALLNQEGDLTPEHRRLIDAVYASRALQDVVLLEGDVKLHPRPVTEDLWQRFRNARSPHPVHRPAQDPGAGHAHPTAHETAAFLDWLNSLFDDGTTYRPPSPQTLTGPGFAALSSPPRHTRWASTSGGGLVLLRPDKTPWPYTPSRTRLAEFPGLLSRELSPFRDFQHLLGPGSKVPALRRLLEYGEVHARHGRGSAAWMIVTALEAAATLAAAVESGVYQSGGLPILWERVNVLCRSISFPVDSYDFPDDSFASSTQRFHQLMQAAVETRHRLGSPYYMSDEHWTITWIPKGGRPNSAQAVDVLLKACEDLNHRLPGAGLIPPDHAQLDITAWPVIEPSFPDPSPFFPVAEALNRTRKLVRSYPGLGHDLLIDLHACAYTLLYPLGGQGASESLRRDWSEIRPAGPPTADPWSLLRGLIETEEPYGVSDAQREIPFLVSAEKLACLEPSGIDRVDTHRRVLAAALLTAAHTHGVRHDEHGLKKALASVIHSLLALTPEATPANELLYLMHG
ncbi:NACHT domain-containing protein [Actinocorallia herbida]|uniref:NACHT domain-containing protein n=1 Tax=Actinocorallia herbida TaxID=58109 RepID=UPI001477032D|nr:NACHT domain-containing protein [Actinocorallia herbida]